MASKNVWKLSPVRSVTIPRCTTERDWEVSDMAVRGNKLAVCGDNKRTYTQSFIDLFTLNDSDSSSPLMTQLWTKLLDRPRFQHHYVSILDDSHIVTVCCDIVHVYHIEADDSEPSHTVNLLHNRIAECLTVREGEIFIGLCKPNEVIVFDFSLNKIKTITLEGLKRHAFHVHLDITVYEDNLFISTYYQKRTTYSSKAIRYNMEGKIVHEYKSPGYSNADSITVSGLVYILWNHRHVVVYSLSDSQQLMSFDVDVPDRIRIVDVNRLLTVRDYTGEVREYSMDFNLLTKRYLQKVFAEMTRSDTEHLANFFMLPLEHVKAIINSPSHSKDLFVELENRGIIQSALTDEFSENLKALNILTGRSEGSKSSIRIPSSTFRKQEEGGYIPEEEEGASGYIPEKEEDWKPPDTMKITSSISEKGGLLQIPNTGIKLIFPPNAVTEELNIQVKIIPPSLLNEPATSFSSNSSVVLELLPNGLQLKREVSLTLPHCLTFINEEKAKAKVYVSHHEEGQRPRWEERPLSPYIFHRSKCTVRLLGFCWVKIVIDDKEVEAKNIVVFATKDILQDKKTANLEVGYYEDIPERGESNILELNPDMKPEKKLKLKFLKEGKQPLTISFNGTDPGNTWAIEQDKPKKEISWQSIAGSEDRLVSFVLQRKQTQDSFCNVSAQQGNSDPIIFVLKLEGNQSTGEIADSTVPDCILEYLAEKLSSEWQSLAMYLNISDADLDNLKEANRRCHQDVKYFMLRLWRKRNGTGATYRVLATALDKADQRDLREYVERQDRNLLRIEYLHTKSKTMASKNVSKLSPVRSVTIPRFTTDSHWLVSDMAVRGNKLAVCIHNDRTDTFIDLFTLNDPDSSLRLMTQLCTKDVYRRWRCNRFLSFLDDSHIVTGYHYRVQVYHIEADDSEPSHTAKILHYGLARCVTVRKGEIFIGLNSDKVIVFDFSLNQIKTITLEGLEGYPADITVYGDDLFISAVDLRAIRHNMEGNIVHEYKTPGYSRALSITVSGLVYILWNYLHVVVYSLSDSQQLMSFDVDFTDRIRIVDVNRLLTVDNYTCEVREYSLPPDVLKQELFSEMTRSDCENLANFFMLPLKHVKAIVNSPSYSKDLLVELENKGIIQSALTDEFSENLRALNIKLLTGISEGSKSSIRRHSPTLLKKVKGEGSKSSIRRHSPTLLKKVKGEQRKSSINRSSSTFHKQQLTVGEEAWKPPDTMTITSSISGKGGLLQIPNTGIKLVFPPKAVTEEFNIQVKIIPPSVLNESATSFSSNSSVVLELLPNGLQLKHEVSLTLPHCLTFINEEKAKAKIYVSHHEEGQRPSWEEKPLSTYIFHRSKCTLRLLGFCWLKIKIDDTEVEAKNLVVFAAKKILRNKETAKVEVGYYEDIPERGEPNILKLNPDIKPERSLQLKFMKEGKQPLTISFNGTDPDDTWYTKQGKAKEEISWQSIALSEERLVPFVLRRRKNMDSFCNFSAQQGNHNPIKFEIELEVDQSTGEIADSTVPDCILEYLAEKLCSEWQSLARYLNISDADLDNLKEDNRRSHQDTKYFMLRLWRKRNGTGATCRVLATALDKAGRKDLQRYVERQVPMQSRNEPTQVLTAL